MDVQTMGELFVNDENSQPASLLGATFLDSTCQAEDAIAVEVGVSIDPNKPTDGDHKNANSESSVTMGSGSHPCQDAGVVISGSASGSKNLSEQVSGQKEERRNPDQFMNGHSKPELAFQKRERVVAVEKSNGKITPEPIDERLGLGRNSGSSERVDLLFGVLFVGPLKHTLEPNYRLENYKSEP
ncbi:unnamed protein product [Calicophoron daubneyi]|uniref:Uncharacterized protein n=1 Tax=Calicophoron daubneyi TaxID=300641 RepID=A0AAV2TCD7_CALDB